MSTLSVTEQVGAAHREAAVQRISFPCDHFSLQLVLVTASELFQSLRHCVKYGLWARMAGLDSLAILQQELQRIGKNQLTLRSAIDNDKAIVLHPSQQAMPVPPALRGLPCLTLPAPADVTARGDLNNLRRLWKTMRRKMTSPRKQSPSMWCQGASQALGLLRTCSI